jgi:hypothetical protein
MTIAPCKPKNPLTALGAATGFSTVPNLAANQRSEGWILAIALAKKRSTTGGTQRNKLVKGLKGFAIVNFTISLELDKNSR